jgi:HlyD family secretion protein
MAALAMLTSLGGIAALVHGAGARTLTIAAGTVTLVTARVELFRDVVAVHGTLQPREILYLDAVSGGRSPKSSHSPATV